MRHKNIMERRVRLKSVNPFITCTICKGYLVEATTITECLHTFCKTCIVKYLEENNTCPKCDLVIHQSHPLNYISHDRTMQAIVYKLVPNLMNQVTQKELNFYKKRGLAMPVHLQGLSEDNLETEIVKENGEAKPQCDDPEYHRGDEQVNLCLECCYGNLKALKRRYIRCSMNVTVTHLKKFLAMKLYNNPARYKEVEVVCNEELLGKDHTLKFVCVTRWRYKDIPLKLNYRPKLEL